MTNALEIAASRFAAGEITDQEYRSIVATLLPASGQAPSDTTGTPTPIPKSSGWMKWAGGTIGVAITFLLLRAMLGGGPNTLHINTIRSDGLFGDLVTGQLLNEGNGTNAWVWIEINAKSMCPRKTYIPAQSTYSFKFNCYDLLTEAPAKFTAKVSNEPPDWVREHALSL